MAALLAGLATTLLLFACFPVIHRIGLLPPLAYTMLDRRPRLSPDRAASLHAARGRLRGLANQGRASFEWTTDPARIAELAPAVTAAAAGRRAEAGRAFSPCRWARDYGQAREVGVLWLDGGVAAWLLGQPGRTYRVLGSQRGPGSRVKVLVAPGFLIDDELCRRLRAQQAARRVCWGRAVHAETMLVTP
jgi:hypothetical protein